jgi:bacterial/archaeal transporter family-2 protein
MVKSKLGRESMKGSLFAFLGGAFITLQGVANARISNGIGTWQTATITQFTGFLVAFLILIITRDRKFVAIKQVKPLYLTSGAFGALIIFSNVTAIHINGVTFTISVLLIAQLCLTFIIDSKGYFGVEKLNISSPQFLGIGLMIVGVMILGY